jgi:hypothetical protein
MFELIDSAEMLAIFCVTPLAIVLVFGLRSLRWPKASPLEDRRGEPYYTHLLRKMPL